MARIALLSAVVEPRNSHGGLIMAAFVVIAYVAACVLTGIYGRRRRLGFIGSSVISFFITPLLVLVVLFFTAPKDA
jgi:hypothetical protein